MSERGFAKTYQTLLLLLKASLTSTEYHPVFKDEQEKSDLIKEAADQAVLSLLYEDESIRSFVVRDQRIRVLQYYKLLYESKRITSLLAEHGISSVVLKGVTIAAEYPVCEYRKTGDVDIMLEDASMRQKAHEVLLANGYSYFQNTDIHHHEMFRKNGIEFDVHTAMHDPFEKQEINTYLNQVYARFSSHIAEQEFSGVCLPVLDPVYQKISLLVHMLQHFMNIGFGVKLLCDWMMFSQNHDVSYDSDYGRLLDDLGLHGFEKLIDSCCIRYLGMKKDMELTEESVCEQFMADLYDAKEFGFSNTSRTVTLTGTGIMDYLKMFHHQMHHNYPNAGRIFLLWPLLWVLTLVRFLVNNRRLRHTTLKEVLSTAKKRAGYIEDIGLFKE